MNNLQQLQELMSELKKPFDQSQERKRPGPKKKINGSWVKTEFKYIPTLYVSERLDEVCPLKWSWEVLASKSYSFDKEVNIQDYTTKKWSKEIKTVNHVAVLGRLSIVLPDGSVSFRDAWGGSELDKGTQAADCYKIADSNAFKKAAYKFGVASYLGLDGLEADVESDEIRGSDSYENSYSPSNRKQKVQQSQDDNPFV